VLLEHVADGLHVAGTSIVLRSPGVDWQVTDGTATAVITSPIVLELQLGSPSEEDTDWLGWAEALRLPATRRDLVRRSALTLRALCHRDTGAVLAAATTSLPEQIGGVRNWDYRYCWLRAAALTVQALVSLGSTGEAEAFLAWLHDVVKTVRGPEHLNRLYTVHGTALGPEVVIDSLPGYAGSGPIRVGNLADQQVQLDVFGPITDLVHDLALARGRLADRDWDVVTAMVRAVTSRWNEPDHGIWEERHVPRHRVYSRVMCWQTSTAPSRRRLGSAARWTPAGSRCATPSPPTCSTTAGTPASAPSPPPTTAPTSTPPPCTWASRASSTRPTTASCPRSSRSRRPCVAARPSTATCATTVSPATRAASTSARRG
jgi:hypothetical protein